MIPGALWTTGGVEGGGASATLGVEGLCREDEPPPPTPPPPVQVGELRVQGLDPGVEGFKFRVWS